ncbi:SDR family NAD(P)-dependent oxidoreductase [Schlegelella sp. S2-27]|uniref:SDR family NAD(P)-dependent oxidoreductase n=1 Tax=Caldimonas mangrovi TaxID=2944811 RepID=A0ABT0YW28_9BURK|nr:type I polyketide synthase [Caldimonas mangrovi]MCM5682955.1 SDR family NAD(P)-dependent oxidoreductase [Caldimonas mangrovi]
MNDQQTQPTGVEVAVVGMAGRFPGADDVDAFWRNVRDGVESVTEFDDAALRQRGVDVESLADPQYVKSGVVLDGMDRFDAGFFGYTPREAELLDPQQRLFLETAWQALENAGHAGISQGAAVGVYAGSGANVYLLRHLLPTLDIGKSDMASLLSVLNGNDKDTLATRTAYKLDLRGPAVSVQTACSTSLVAVHLACRALLNHEADMVLAGGVWLNLLQQGGYRYQPGAILSPDGHCRAFDARAAGTVIGSGVGVVVLRRLADALHDGDTIHAVIKGSALNNDGAAKVGYTAPSVEGQAQVIRAAQAMADVAADSIGYVEAHGTGTILGDPIEVAALTQAFRADTQRCGYCALGSVKTNVGHLDAAAGVAGLIKTVMALKHRTLPASLNYQRPNPEIDFESSPFYVCTDSRPWPRGTAPRRAGVSAFGMGGTNVHVILEEAPAVRAPAGPEAAASSELPLLLSARSKSALDGAVEALARHLPLHPAPPLADVAHTLRVGRKRYEHRAVAIARDVQQASLALTQRAPASFVAGQVLSEHPEVAFLFPGQGAQHVHMGAQLYRDEAVFREAVDRCCELLAPQLDMDLRRWIYPRGPDEAVAAERLQQTACTQPALFVVEYAATRLWDSWGVRPAAMLGHSLGEYVAACLAGVFSLEDALMLVAARGRLLQAMPPGAMLAVGLGESQLAPWLQAGCDLAAVNGVDLSVLSGPWAAIEAAERELQMQGVTVRRLHVSHAFHSRITEPMLAEYESLLRRVELGEPRLPFISNVSGTWITAEQARSPSYWVRHVRGTVRFEPGLAELLRRPDRLLLEVGPGETLGALARRHPMVERRPVVSTLAHPQQHDRERPLRALAQLWVAGVDVEAALFRDARPGRRVPLPTYPFERQSYWVAPPRQALPPRPAAFEPKPIDEWFYIPSWRRVDMAGHDVGSLGVSGCVLLFADAGGVAEQLARRLTARDVRVVTVRAGGRAERRDALHYVLAPSSDRDHLDLVAAVQSDHGPIAAVFHCWSVDDGAPFEQGFLSLAFLGRALQQSRAAAPGRTLCITVVACGVEEVTDVDVMVPQKAALHGACKVIPQEVEGVVCRLVDIGVQQQRRPDLADALLAELVGDAQAPSVVAYRGAQRWLQCFEPVRRPRSSCSRLRRGGVYLVTGGLGGIGLLWARHLAATQQARLVLLGRNGLPAREEWSALLARSDLDPGLRSRLAQLAALESLGAEVLVLKADVADEAALRGALSAARDRFGAVHGVIHAAGEAGGAMLSALTAEDVERAFAAKVLGTQALLAACRDEKPDFVLLCSSLASVAGGLGKAAYAAANACMDALARQAARSVPYPVWAVDWDGWREIGMAAGLRLPDGIGISAEQGIEVFERVLCGPATPQVVVSTLDLHARLAHGQEALFAPPAEAPHDTGIRHARPALSTPYEAPEGDLERSLADLWGQLLGIAPIGAHDPLFELGGDSLLAIQLLSRVRSRFDVQVHPADFFKQPTVAALAELVETRLLDEIERA